MIEPTGYTALDLIGFTDRGAYDPTANYVKNDIVTVGNTKWRCKVDDTTGVTPAENANWTIYLESATSLAGMDDTDITSPKSGDGLVHDGNDWKNIPIMTKEQWKKNGAYNLLRCDVTTHVSNAVTFTKYSDGSFLVNGTNSSASAFDTTINASITADDLPAGTYTISSGAVADNDKYYFAVDSFNNGVYVSTLTYLTTSNSASITVNWSGYNSISVTLKIRGSQQVSNVTFKPMIHLSTDTDTTFTPYAKTNRQLTEDALTANDVAFVKEAFNLQANSSKTITLKTTVSLLVGVYGSNGFAYLVHDNGGVYQIANSNDGISASLSTHTLTITNSGTHSYRTRLLELGQS